MVLLVGAVPLNQLVPVVQPVFPALFFQLCCAARASVTTTTPAASASKTAIRIRRKDENGGLEFIGRGMNGGPIRKRKRASTPQKRQIPRHTKIPSPPAEREYKRRKRRVENGGMGSHTIVLHGGKGGLKNVIVYVYRTTRVAQVVKRYTAIFFGFPPTRCATTA